MAAAQPSVPPGAAVAQQASEVPVEEAAAPGESAAVAEAVAQRASAARQQAAAWPGAAVEVLRRAAEARGGQAEQRPGAVPSEAASWCHHLLAPAPAQR
jgi:hypothetical protein